jgi:hypothetical protein
MPTWQPRDQRHHVDLILQIGVISRIAQPFAAAPPDDIDGDHAVGR